MNFDKYGDYRNVEIRRCIIMANKIDCLGGEPVQGNMNE